MLRSFPGGITFPATLIDQLGERMSRSGSELCGFVSGNAHVRAMEARTILWLANLYLVPDRFAVSQEDASRALSAKPEGEEIIAFLHTHRLAPAAPSAVDIRSMEYSTPVWLIACPASHGSICTPSVRAWTLERGREVEIPVSVT